MRRFVRANGEGVVAATEGRPEVLQAVHDLKNWEVRQAAINAGIDVGQQHVGSRQGLGPAQVSRQQLLDQMIQQGVKPEDIPKLARTEEVPYTKPMSIAPKRLGKGFVENVMTTMQVIHHELAHAILGGLDNFNPGAVISHRYPGAKGAAAVLYNFGQFKGLLGLLDPTNLANGRGDAFVDMIAAGAAANELIDGLPRETNPGLRGDIKMAARFFDAMGYKREEWKSRFDASIDRAAERLRPFVDLIKDEATRREDNLQPHYHFSENRVKHIVELARDIDAKRRVEAGIQQPLPYEGAGFRGIDPQDQAAIARAEEANARGVRPLPRPEENLKPYKPPQNKYTFDIDGRILELEAVDRKAAWKKIEKNPDYQKGALVQMVKEEVPEVGPPVEIPSLKNVPARLARHLLPDEISNLEKRPVLQKNFVKAYDDIAPTANEIKNAIRAGHGLGGWWQRFIDSFEALGRTTDAQAIRDLGFEHAEALKSFHGALSGNKFVSAANRIAWGAYRDWLEAGRPTDVRSVNRIIKANRGVSGIGNLDTNQLFKLVNSPQFQQGAPFHGQAWEGSPVPGKGSGSKKIPSMVATTAGTGNLGRVVLDAHMAHLYGLNKMSDAQYLAMSVHMREAAEMAGLAGGEGQEQAWGTIIALKKLMKTGLSPGQAAKAFGPDVVGSIGKDYAQTILDSMDDPEVRQAMEDLKKFGFDPGGPIASRALKEIAEEGAQRMRERARPGISERMLAQSARRIQQAMEEKRAAIRRRRGGG